MRIGTREFEPTTQLPGRIAMDASKATIVPSDYWGDYPEFRLLNGTLFRDVRALVSSVKVSARNENFRRRSRV
jgi:hypothetical protein